ncbi:unnamed protein product [Cylindrotheca closterium]|uniref:Uncharacterized protein n=1 Tax=Cylindrotheca closterium TaxID=2856 RepID=A0AAD2FZL5_9STRA|nr:unnamed protein product [Cylindrotheca closterium]
MITLTTTTTTTNTSPKKPDQSSSSGFGFWSLNNTSSLQSSTFSYSSPNKKKNGPLATTTVSPILTKDPTISTVVAKQSPPSPQPQPKKKKKVNFQLQCQVRTFEVVALDEDFENNCEDDEEYWEQMGEDFWYQAYDFQAFKKDRRSLVDRIRTIGVKNAKGNYAMEGLEFFLTLKAREVHKERVLDGWVSVLELQAEWEKDQSEGDCSEDDKVELIASKYAHVSKACLEDANKRAIETAQEIQAEDEKIVASIPKSPQPKKGSLQKDGKGVKALGVWGNTWSSTGTSTISNNTTTTTSFSTFQKIRPFPRQ